MQYICCIVAPPALESARFRGISWCAPARTSSTMLCGNWRRYDAVGGCGVVGRVREHADKAPINTDVFQSKGNPCALNKCIRSALLVLKEPARSPTALEAKKSPSRTEASAEICGTRTSLSIKYIGATRAYMLRPQRGARGREPGVS